MSKEKILRPSLILLVAITCLEPLGETMHTPAFTAISQYFGVIPFLTKLSTIVYIIAFAVSLLVYGFLSDKYGRRPLLLSGLIIYAIGAVLCSVVQYYPLFLAAKALQGLGGAAGVIIVRAMIRETCNVAQQRHYFVYISGMDAVALLAGPVIGGFIVTNSNWQHIFVVMSVLSFALTALCVLKLPETLRKKTADLAIKKSFFELLPRLRSKTVVCHTIMSSCLSGAAISFAIIAPFLFIKQMGLTAQQCGLLMSSASIAYIAGAFFVNRLVSRITVGGQILIGAVVASVGASLLLIFFLLSYVSVLTIVLPIALLSFGAAFVKPNALCATLAPFNKHIGKSSSFLKLMQTGLTALIILGTQALPIPEIMLLPITIFVLAMTTLIFSVYYYHPPKFSIRSLSDIFLTPALGREV